MNWDLTTPAFVDELHKIAEARKKPLSEKVVDTGAPMLAGAGIGKTLSDLSWSKDYGASPRRKTVGTLLGAAGGLAYHMHQQKKKERKRAHRAQSAGKTKTAMPALSKAQQESFDKAYVMAATTAGLVGGAFIGSQIAASEGLPALPMALGVGAASGLANYGGAKLGQWMRKKYLDKKTKTAGDPFKFPSSGSATAKFLSKPGKSIPNITPKIGRLGTLPKFP